MAKIESVYDVATVLGSLDTRRWLDVKEAIRTGGKGHPFALDLDFGEPAASEEWVNSLYDEAAQIAENNRFLRQAARGLHGNLSEAIKRVERAQHNIGELKDLGAIDYLEGNDEVESLLKQARTLLLAAQALKSTDETGEMK